MLSALRPLGLGRAGIAFQGQALREGEDAAAPPVVLSNETSARRYWPDDEPLGARVRISVGIENPQDLILDIKQALDKV